MSIAVEFVASYGSDVVKRTRPVGVNRSRVIMS